MAYSSKFLDYFKKLRFKLKSKKTKPKDYQLNRTDIKHKRSIHVMFVGIQLPQCFIDHLGNKMTSCLVL